MKRREKKHIELVGTSSCFSFLFFILSLTFIFNYHSAKSQDVTATLKVDSNHISIGDLLNVKLTVKFPKDVIVSMPPVADTVGNMEFVKASKIDTAVAGNFRTMTRTYQVSAYDSGNFHAGPLKIVSKNQGGIIDSVYSDSIPITVYTVAVDTSKAFKAIKATVDVPYTLNEFLPYIIGGAVLVAILVAVIIYLRRRSKRKPKVVERPRPKDPAHIWAKKELKKLEEEKLWQKDQIKSYYSRLSDIVRLYLEYRYNWLALESTTEKISDDIGMYDIPEDAKKELLMILGEADLVKFAKRIPMPDANVRVMERTYGFVEKTEVRELKTEEMKGVKI